MAAICCMKRLFWPVSLAGMSRTGRYLPYEAGALDRIGGRYDPYLGVICRMAWLFWPVSVAVMRHIGRYLLCGVAVLSRISGRYEPYWPLFAV